MRQGMPRGSRAVNPAGAADARGVACAVITVFTLIASWAPSGAYAGDFVVYAPYVSRDRSEIEFRGYGFQDGDPALDGTRGYDFSFAYGVTDWWKPEVYFAEYGREPGGGTTFTGNEFENTFQLAPVGEYWADPGLLFSYEHSKASGQADTLEFGPLFAKRIGRTEQRLNLIWEKEIGGGASGKYAFRSAYSLSYRLTSLFQPGAEAYYRPDDHASHLGPVVSGEWRSATGLELEYSIGMLFGLNARAPDRTLVTRLEFEF
ncbi:MAG: hypothetical protein P8164_13735 [Gammaproteobacteria bacterium]